MKASSSAARHTRRGEALVARLASTTPSTDYATVLAVHVHNYARRDGIDLTAGVALEDLVRPVRARARPGPGPRRRPGVNADHIAERTRVLLESAAATSWAGHVAPYLPGREQLLAAIAVYRDRYDVEHPSLLGPPPLEADAKRLATWTDLAHALSAERTDVPNEEPGNGGPDFDDWGPEETGPTGP
ncbi:hypothetical protein ACTVBU_10745 [Sanguibacter sp. A246]|uniref:hypothetical protein n=1 Tax=Sanguibacter sp. A246 TaxID=3457326 RepID=UPI003FD7790E